jgi:hypothetical protein
MKLGCIYTVFNAMELFAGSAEQIYDEVDIILVVWQEVSNRGNEMSFEDSKHILQLKETNKVHLIKFEPDLKLNTKQNELNKHNQGLEYLKNLNCTHFMLSATDHYYFTNEFQYAKRYAEESGVDVTLTSMFTYYKKPTFQLYPIEEYYMPFICLLYPETKYVNDQWKYKVDPALRLNTKASMYLFEQEEIMMHHYSMIRKDIENKFNNAAASVNWMQKIPAFIEEYNNAKIGDSIRYFKGRKLIEVPDYFKIK